MLLPARNGAVRVPGGAYKCESYQVKISRHSLLYREEDGLEDELNCDTVKEM